jgi:hypothetical protein
VAALLRIAWRAKFTLWAVLALAWVFALQEISTHVSHGAPYVFFVRFGWFPAWMFVLPAVLFGLDEWKAIALGFCLMTSLDVLAVTLVEPAIRRVRIRRG